MPFLLPNQQRQSTEVGLGNNLIHNCSAVARSAKSIVFRKNAHFQESHFRDPVNDFYLLQETLQF